MATADSVKAKIQELITSANSVTGENNSNLSDAVANLIAGFGNSGSEGTPGQATVHMGTYIAPERSDSDIVFPVPSGATYFVLFMKEVASKDTGCAYITMLVVNKETEYLTISGSNSNGTSSSASQVYATGEPSLNYYPGLIFGEDKVTYIPFRPLVSYCRLPQPGKTYIWLAW